MTHQLRIVCPAAIFGVLTWVCICGHRSYTFHDWTLHNQLELT